MAAPVLMVLNAGSSSLKFQIFEEAEAAEFRVVCRGLFEGLGGEAHFVVRNGTGENVDEMAWAADEGIGHEQALMHLIAWLRHNQADRELLAIGHRVVHGGMSHFGPVVVDDAVLKSLEALVPLAPLHQPHNLEPIRIARRRLPQIPQVACFDTAFHRSQPALAQMFALPREMRERGVQRYGFHGLSYAYIASVLADYDPGLAAGRVVVAHLGSGASLCALKGGVSVATTMGFSALDGLPMGTRCGALDPGVVFYMLRDMNLSPAEAERMLYTKSGLLGVSGLSNDMRLLRSSAGSNAEARQAIDLFVYRIQREIGSLVAALGGLDGLIFTAGIGEKDAATRAEVVAGLAFVGAALDPAANAAGGPRISVGPGPSIFVIPTDEEVMVARGMRSVLGEARPRLAS